MRYHCPSCFVIRVLGFLVDSVFGATATAVIFFAMGMALGWLAEQSVVFQFFWLLAIPCFFCTAAFLWRSLMIAKQVPVGIRVINGKE